MNKSHIYSETSLMKTIMKSQLSLLFSLATLLGGINSLHAQGVAQGTSQYVNQFTGDFNYSVPLLTITGPNGEAFPLTANYSAGITVQQEASWIGLGWSLNTGAIHRQVNGVPDDWNGKVAHSEKGITTVMPGPPPYNDKSLKNRPYTHEYYGPLYYHKFPAPGSVNNYPSSPNETVEVMDTYRSDRGLSQNYPFEFPNYDSYFLSGPGIGGSIKPQLLEFGTLQHFDEGDYHHSYFASENKTNNFTRTKVKFHYRGEPGAQIKAPYYGIERIANGPFWQTYLDMEDNNLSSINANFKTPKAIETANDNYNGDINTALDRQLGGHFVEYWTNAEIYDHHYAGSNVIDDFLDFEIVSGAGDRTGSNYDSDGIGAYRVTTPSGMVYHYSLPVYTIDEKVYSFDLNNDYTYAGAFENIQVNRKADRYATSWLLTAITGLDYSDANANGIADAGDKGYWIALEYTRWWDDFTWRSPHYGYHSDLQSKRNVEVHSSGLAIPYSTYGESGNVSMGTKQLWYLDKIKTATQTAFFVKEVRKDAHGFEETASTNPQPKLSLSKIVLLDNADLAQFPTTTNITNQTGGSFTLPSGDVLETVNIDQYNANAANIEAVALRTVEFGQDYTLANNTYNNIASNYTTSDQTIAFTAGPLLVYRKIDSKSNAAASGKLTLNRITAYEFGYAQITPSWEFDYNSSNLNVNDNPDYDHRKTTYFGHYNSDNSASTVTSNIVRGGYTTSTNKDGADAWSLRKVLTPLGGEMTINYEADKFELIGYNNESQTPVAPERIFRISTMNFASTTPISTTITPIFNVFETGDVSGLLMDANVEGIDIYYYYDCAPLSSCGRVYKVGSDVTINQVNSTIFQVTAGITAASCDNSGCNAPTYTFDGVEGYAYLRFRMKSALGGGIRVASIDVREQPNDNTIYSNTFTYEKGICSNEPDRFVHDEFSNKLRRSRLAADRHAMGPSVGYSTVTEQQTHWVSGNNITQLGKTVTQFNNYTEPFVVQPKPAWMITGSTGLERQNLYEVIHVKNVLNYGQPQSSWVYDKDGELMASTQFQYETLDENMGRTEEVFYRGMRINNTTGQYDVNQVKSVYYKKELTSALRKTTSFIDGITTTTEIEQRDKYTGIPTRIRIESPTQGVVYQEKQLAYEVYPNMGLKTESPTKENRLTATYKELAKYLDTDDDDTKGGGKQEFATSFNKRTFTGGAFTNVSTTGYYRPKAAYAFEEYTGGALTWKYAGETTLYDEQDRVLEQKGIDNTFSAIRYGYDNRYAIAQAGNANFASFTHCGFETNTDMDNTSAQDYYFEGEVKNSTNLSALNFQLAGTTQKPAHTGDYMAEVPANYQGPIFTTKENNVVVSSETVHQGLQPGRTYRASVWVHNDSPNEATLVMHLNGQYNGGTTINDVQSVDKTDAVYTAGDWKLLQVNLTVPEDYVSSGGTNNDLRVYIENNSSTTNAWFDDLRFQPVDAQVSYIVYDKKRGLVTHALDNENFFSRNVYDNGGRVIETWIEQENGQKKTSSNTYHFARD